MTTYPVKLYNWELEVPNLKEYHTLKREIFSQHHYYLELEKPNPVIIDAGAHIGLSTFYFKRLFPDSLIIALEPNPKSYALLKKNLEANQIHRVLPLNLALWPLNQIITFYSDPSADSWWSNTRTQLTSATSATHTQTFSAQTTTLKELTQGIGEKIDLLKLDVEGAEWDILFTSLDHFTHIDHYVIEYHPFPSRNLNDFCTSFPNSHRVSCFKNGKPLNPKTRNPGLVIIKVDRVGAGSSRP